MTDVASFVGEERGVAGKASNEGYFLRSPQRPVLTNFQAENDNQDEDYTQKVRHFEIPAPKFGKRVGQLALKRIFDVVVSGISLLILAPTLLLIALLVKIESAGPALFLQRRTGLNGNCFDILKFRTMYSGLGDPSGIAQTLDKDARITRVGAFLRKTNLDELPQLWNVLIGDMSLVGPRPHVPGMLAAGVLYEDLVKGYEYRHLVRPGLTGLAQSRGLRGPTDNRWKAIRRVVCDVEYVKNFSLVLDVKILVRTMINEFYGGTGS